MGSGYWFGLILSMERGCTAVRRWPVAEWIWSRFMTFRPKSEHPLPDGHGAALRIDGLAGLRPLLDLPLFGRDFEEMPFHRVKLAA